MKNRTLRRAFHRSDIKIGSGQADPIDRTDAPEGAIRQKRALRGKGFALRQLSSVSSNLKSDTAPPELPAAQMRIFSNLRDHSLLCHALLLYHTRSRVSSGFAKKVLNFL